MVRSQGSGEDQNNSVSESGRELRHMLGQPLAREILSKKYFNSENNNSKNKNTSIYCFLSTCNVPGILLNAFSTNLI